MPKYLFIGGRSDGSHIRVPEDAGGHPKQQRINRIGKLIPPNPKEPSSEYDKISTETYLAQRIGFDPHDPSKDIWFYVIEGMRPRDAVLKLIANYVPL